MDRREFFLNTAKASGVMLPWWGMLPITAHAQVASKILIYYHTDGGMVNDMFLDPSPDPRYNLYSRARLAIPGSGNIRIAPAAAGTNIAFLNRFRDQMLVVNGINTQTNSHEDGQIASGTGKLMMGYPHLSELHAAKYAAAAPAGWMVRDGGTLSTGVYPATARFPMELSYAPWSTHWQRTAPRTTLSGLISTRPWRHAQHASGAEGKRGYVAERTPGHRRVYRRQEEARVRLQAVAANIPKPSETIPTSKSS